MLIRSYIYGIIKIKFNDGFKMSVEIHSNFDLKDMTHAVDIKIIDAPSEITNNRKIIVKLINKVRELVKLLGQETLYHLLINNSEIYIDEPFEEFVQD